MMRTLIYALGGGAGHVVRGASLAAALARAGSPSTVLVPAARLELAKLWHLQALGVQRPESPAELLSVLSAVIERLEITQLVVDAFPEGILGELEAPLAAVRRVAVLRLRRDGRSPAFLRALRAYERRFDIEPALEWLPPGVAEPCPPVVRAIERRPSAVDVLLASGAGEHAALLSKLAARLRRAGLRVETRSGQDGLLGARELSARVVVGGAGYNLSYELQRLGSWHIALPCARRFDDQRVRAERIAITCGSPEAIERRVLALVGGSAARGPMPSATHAELARRIAGPAESVDHVQ